MAGGVRTPHQISKATLSDKQETALDRLRRDLELLQRSFSGQVNIDVNRDHRRRNFGTQQLFSLTITSYPANVWVAAIAWMDSCHSKGMAARKNKQVL